MIFHAGADSGRAVKGDLPADRLHPVGAGRRRWARRHRHWSTRRPHGWCRRARTGPSTRGERAAGARPPQPPRRKPPRRRRARDQGRHPAQRRLLLGDPMSRLGSHQGPRPASSDDACSPDAFSVLACLRRGGQSRRAPQPRARFGVLSPRTPPAGPIARACRPGWPPGRASVNCHLARTFSLAHQFFPIKLPVIMGNTGP